MSLETQILAGLFLVGGWAITGLWTHYHWRRSKVFQERSDILRQRYADENKKWRALRGRMLDAMIEPEDGK